MPLFKSPAWDVDVSSEILNKQLFGVGSKKRNAQDRPPGEQDSKKKLKLQRNCTRNENATIQQNTSLVQNDKFHTKIKGKKHNIASLLLRKKHKTNKLKDNQRNAIETLPSQSTEVSKITNKQKAKEIQHKVRTVKKSQSGKNNSTISSLKSRFKSKSNNKFTLPIEISSSSAADIKSDTYQPIRDETDQMHLLSSKCAISAGSSKSKSKKAKKRHGKMAAIVSNDAHFIKPILKGVDSVKEDSIKETNQLYKATNSDKQKEVWKLKNNQPGSNSGSIIQDNLKMPTRRNPGTLRDRMLKRLQASRFRYLNQQMYCSQGKEALEYFQTDPAAFQAYHHGYRQQLAKWPLNPLSTIINSLKKKSSNLIVADFGCGDAQLAQSLPNTVHSFDLVALSDDVTVCDMAHTPLGDSSVDVTVFCLSLMGTNLTDYLIEANRILKMRGIMKIAEVESRFEDVTVFIKTLMKYGFTIIHKDVSHNLFYFLDFQKVSNIKKKKKSLLPTVTLKPCLYKKR